MIKTCSLSPAASVTSVSFSKLTFLMQSCSPWFVCLFVCFGRTRFLPVDGIHQSGNTKKKEEREGGERERERQRQGRTASITYLTCYELTEMDHHHAVTRFSRYGVRNRNKDRCPLYNTTRILEIAQHYIFNTLFTDGDEMLPYYSLLHTELENSLTTDSF